jgi:hypothetical protein
VGAGEQAAALAARAAAGAALDNPAAVAALLRALREVGAQEQAAALAARAADVSLDDPYGVVPLLRALRKEGANHQHETLVNRLPAEGLFDLFCREPRHENLYRFGREPDGNPAPAWSWTDLG